MSATGRHIFDLMRQDSASLGGIPSSGVQRRAGRLCESRDEISGRGKEGRSLPRELRRERRHLVTQCRKTPRYIEKTITVAGLERWRRRRRCCGKKNKESLEETRRSSRVNEQTRPLREDPKEKENQNKTKDQRQGWIHTSILEHIWNSEYPNSTEDSSFLAQGLLRAEHFVLQCLACIAALWWWFNEVLN